MDNYPKVDLAGQTPSEGVTSWRYVGQDFWKHWLLGLAAIPPGVILGVGIYFVGSQALAWWNAPTDFPAPMLPGEGQIGNCSNGVIVIGGFIGGLLLFLFLAAFLGSIFSGNTRR